MPEGNVYLVDVQHYHATSNDSQTNRVHLTLEIKKCNAAYIETLKGKI